MLEENEEFEFNALEIMYKMSKNEAIFFLGSGFSMNFEIYRWTEFINNLIENLQDEIDKPEIKFKFQKNITDVLDDLKIIKYKISKNMISLDYAIDMIYLCMEFKPEEKSEDSNRKGSFIKKIYLEHFKINVEKLDEKKANITLLKKIREKVKKIITTNYDNLFLFDYAKYLDKNDHFSMPYFDFENLDYLFSKQTDYIYMPIHGNVLNDNFQNEERSIWEKYLEDGSLVKYQSPIIDSFSSFQKNYVKDGGFFKKFLENFLIQASNNQNIVIFFGYSFNDYFVSKEIIETLNGLVPFYNEREKDLVYIVYDDLSDYIMNALDSSKQKIKAKPLLSYDFVKYVSYSSIFLNDKSSEEVKKFQEILSEINLKKIEFENLCFIKNNFPEKGKKENVILNIVYNLEKTDEAKNIVYRSLLNEIKKFYKKYEEQILSFIKTKTLEEPLLEKYFFYIWKMRKLKKTNIEIFQDIKDRFIGEMANMELYLYGFLSCNFFSNENKTCLTYLKASKLFCENYEKISEDYRKIIKKDIIVLLSDYLKTLSKSKKKEILERLS